MKKRLLGVVTASMILTTGAMAAKSGTYIAAGYGSASIDGTTKAAPILDMGLQFGEKYKQTIATKFIFTGSNSNLNDGQGNIGEFYYSLGYDVYKDITLSAKLGYGFEELGTTSDGTTLYAGGVSYGAIAKYSISNSFETFASYTHMNLSGSGVNYSVDVADISVAYVF